MIKVESKQKNKHSAKKEAERNGEKMKEKMQKDLFKVGSKHVDHWNLKAYEAISMTVVGILSITLGQIYGSLLF